MTPKIKIATLAGILTMTGPVFAGISLNFDNPGEFAANFSTAQTASLISQSTSGGLGDTGSIEWGPITQPQVWTLNTPFQGDLASWSAEFFMHGTMFTAFGFTTMASPGEALGYPTNSQVTEYLPSIFIASDPSDGGVFGIIQNGNVAPEAVEFTSEALNEGWYRYRIEVEHLGLGEYEVMGIMHTSDASGELISEIGRVSASVSNPALAAGEAHLFLGFNQVGISIDHFQTTIPEPASAGLLIGSAGLLLRRRRG